MHAVNTRRAVLALLVAPLVAVTVGGGLLAVASLDGARDARQVRMLASAVPDLIRLQESVAAERALAVTRLATGRSAVGVLAARSATDGALAQATSSIRALRANPSLASEARLAEVLRAVRRSIDTGHATATSAGADYTAATSIIAAVPAGVAVDVGQDRLTRPAVGLADRLQTADAASLVQLAGDRARWAGGSAGRVEYDGSRGGVGRLEQALPSSPSRVCRSWTRSCGPTRSASSMACRRGLGSRPGTTEGAGWWRVSSATSRPPRSTCPSGRRARFGRASSRRSWRCSPLGPSWFWG